jgi:hypothetical protein
MAFSWDRRIARAGELSEKHAAVSELLRFYQQLVRFQKRVYEQLSSAQEHVWSAKTSSTGGKPVLCKKSVDGAESLIMRINAFAESGSGDLRFSVAVTVLLLEAAVGSCLIVNPVLLRVSHSMTAGNLTCRPRFVERTRTRTVAKCLGSVAAQTRIPLINNHLDCHLASPHAARALFLVGSCCKSPMTAVPVDRKRRWNTAPRGRLCVSLNFLSSDFQIADLIILNGFKTWIGNRQRIPGYGVTGLEMVLSVGAFPYADKKFSGLTSDTAAYP